MANRKPVELTQSQVLELLGIGLPRLKKLQGQGMPGAEPGSGLFDGRKVVSWWVDHNLSQVVGVTEDKVDERGQVRLKLDQEAARLNKARADAVERENAIAAGKYVPCEVLEILLEQPIAEITAALDALPQQIKNDIPHLRAAEVQLVATRLARVRNNLARYEFSIQDTARESKR